MRSKAVNLFFYKTQFAAFLFLVLIGKWLLNLTEKKPIITSSCIFVYR